MDAISEHREAIDRNTWHGS